MRLGEDMEWVADVIAALGDLKEDCQYRNFDLRCTCGSDRFEINPSLFSNVDCALTVCRYGVFKLEGCSKIDAKFESVNFSVHWCRCSKRTFIEGPKAMPSQHLEGFNPGRLFQFP